MKTLVLVGMLFASSDSTERRLAPRSTLLTGTAEAPSEKGDYVITFPPPNNCVQLHVHVDGGSRADALYKAVSRGGFSLKAGNGGLTVWTAEEWVEVPQRFKAESSKACK